MVIKPNIICTLLLLGSVGLAPSSANAFEESPALPERSLPGGEGRQRALPEHFQAIGGPAWAADVPVAPSQTSALIAASQAGRLDQVKALLAAGALPNGADEPGQRPLLAAIAAGHGEIVRLLLQHGASANVKGPQGRTPLGMAAASGQARIVRLLLRADADINARSDNRATALHEAVRFDHPEIVRQLLAAGPDAAHYDREGLHPLALAAVLGVFPACKHYLRPASQPICPTVAASQRSTGRAVTIRRWPKACSSSTAPAATRGRFSSTEGRPAGAL